MRTYETKLKFGDVCFFDDTSLVFLGLVLPKDNRYPMQRARLLHPGLGEIEHDTGDLASVAERDDDD